MTSSLSKRLIVIAGPNGSGKSSIIYSSGLSVDFNTIINPDNYVRGLYLETSSIEELYKLAMTSCEALRNCLLEQGKSFGFETVASREDKLQFVSKAKSLGYFIDFIFVTAGSPEKCCERIQERVKLGGHDVPREKVYSRYERTMAFLPKYLELADHASVWDNSGDFPILVISKSNGTFDVIKEAHSLPWVNKYLSYLL